MADYKLTDQSGLIMRTRDNAFIPTSEHNPDYLNYLLWLREGNTPDPADIVETPIPSVDRIAKLEETLGRVLVALNPLIQAPIPTEGFPLPSDQSIEPS